MSCSKHVQWEGYIQEVVVVDGSFSVFSSTVLFIINFCRGSLYHAGRMAVI